MKAKFGSFIVAGSGKIGGHVASRNRSGAYLRTKTTPSNPQSADQSEARNRLTTWSQAWRTLTSTQQAAWNSAVENFMRSNVFGDMVKPTGKNLYTGLNTNLDLVSGTNISVPPVPAGTFEFSGASLLADVSDNKVEIAWTSGAIPAGMAALVEATTGLSAGVSNANNKFRLIDILPAADATPTNVYTAWTTKFGTLTAGQKIFIRVTPVNKTTGERGIPLSFSSVVIA